MELTPDPTGFVGLGSLPQDCSHRRWQSQVVGPQVPHICLKLLTNCRLPCPLLGFDNLIEQLIELRKAVFLLLPTYEKGCFKGYRWIARGAIHRARSGRVPSTGTSVPVEWMCTILPAQTCVHQPRNSLHPMLLVFVWRLYHLGLLDHELNLQFLSPPQWVGCGVRWQVPSFESSAPILKLSRNPSRAASFKPKTITQEISRALRAPYWKLEPKTRY